MDMAELPEGHPIKIIGHGRISPPLNSVPTSSLPLTFLDIPWMVVNSVQRVLFYEFPDSNHDFFQNVLPALKSSLAIALKEFYPFAAKIVVPPLPGKPQVVYTDGYTIPFTVAESIADFDELTSNDPQDVKLLHPLVPQMSPWHISEEGLCNIAPLLAIQVTLFPNSGICLGVQYNHTLCDGRSFQHFMKSWASICRTRDLQNLSLPFLDRAIIKDPNDLQTTFLKAWWDTFSKDPNPGLPRSHVDQRATFILSRATINRLKIWISNQSTMLGLELMINISSFAAVCAFAWICIVKSTSEGGQVPLVLGEEDDIDKPKLHHFFFVANCQSRLGTPLPEMYFGNCLVPHFVAMEKNMLLGQDGTVLAARAIAQKVKELQENGDALRGFEICISDLADISREFGVPLSVAGSPRLAVYDTDFGWGRPKKSVVVHIDTSWSISLEETRDEKCGMEIGVVLSKASMAAFTTLFKRLESLIV